MDWGINGHETELLEMVPLPIAIAKPIFADEVIIDLELVWENAALRELPTGVSLIGLRATVVFAEIVQQGWLAEIQKIKNSGEINSIYRIPMDGSSAERSVYRLEARWSGDHLILSIVILGHEKPTRDDAMQAAAVVTKLMPHLPIFYSIHNGSRWVRFPTNQFLTNIGMSAKGYAELNVVEQVHPDDREMVMKWLGTPVSERQMPLFCRLATPLNPEHWVEVWMSDLGQPDSNPEGDVFLLRDVDTYMKLQLEKEDLTKKLSEQLDLVNAAINASRDGFAVWTAVRDETGKVVSFTLDVINEAGAAATGKKPTELANRRIEDVVGTDQHEGLTALFAKALNENQQQTQVVDVDSVQGWVGAYENVVAPFGEDKVLASFRDVSETKREQQRLEWLSEHDSLTGAPNRVYLERHLSGAMEASKLNNHHAGFVFIDIDFFKQVNDTYGHDAGDALLKGFVSRMEAAVPEGVMVARISGDEFALIFPKLHKLAEMNEAMDKVFGAMIDPFDCNGQEIKITVSAGCVMSDGKETGFEVMRLADKAMYKAKHDGKNRYVSVEV